MVTRIVYSRNIAASKLARLTEIARRLGVLRSEIWQKYGSIKGVGKRDREIRDFWLAEGREFNVPASLWRETLRDVIHNISMSRDAAKVKVRRAIYARTKDKDERKRLYRALRRDEWLEDPYLRRIMRKHFRHGHTRVRNQIVLEPQAYTAFDRNGQAWIDVMSLQRRKRIAIPLNTSHPPRGTLRLILRDSKVEVHYAVDDQDACSTRPCGSGTVGVDKGYTEVLTDSDGDQHGEGLGELLSSESDYLNVKYQRRNKIRSIANEKLHKQDRIEQNNLGRKKINARKKKHRTNVRDKVFKAVHSVIDKANTVVSEDLTKQIKSRKRSRKSKRRLSGWVKGTIAEALEQVSQRRRASLVVVNASYTSQMDPRYGVLLGKRKGEKFYCFDGVVFQADHAAALNIKARSTDPEIDLWTNYRRVKSILLRRTEEFKTVGTAQPRLQLRPAA